MLRERSSLARATRSRRGYALVTLILLAGCARRGATASCPLGVSPETARRLFDRAAAISVDAGYRFEGLGTNKTEVFAHWSLNGTACPPIQIIVEGCTPLLGLPEFQLRVPPDLFARCPGMEAVVRELSSASPAASSLNEPAASLARVLRHVFAIIAFVLVAGGLIGFLIASDRDWPLGWRVFGWVAIVAAAAIPFCMSLPVAVTVELGAAWFIFTVLLFDGEVWTARGRELKRPLLGLFVVSLLLHGWLSSGGPGDLHLNLAAIWSPELELRWGPAPVALFRLLGFALGGIQDTDIVRCNLILSSLLPLLLYAIVSELGVSRHAALLAALVTAAHPLLIVFSGVLERQPTYLFAAAGSTLALIGFLKRGGAGRGAAFVLGAVLATASRPEGAHVLILHLVMLLLVPASRRRRGAAAVMLAILIALTWAYLHGALESKPPGWSTSIDQMPLLWTVLFSPDFTPLAWIVASTFGLLVGLRHRAAWVALLAVLGLDLIWRWTGLYEMFVGHAGQVASTRYELILLIPFAIGIALFLEGVLATRNWVKVSLLAACVVLTAATFGRPYDTLIRPFTIDHEYRFLQQQALTLPPGSRLYVLDAPIDDIGFIDANLVGQFVGSTVRFHTWSERRCDDFLENGAPTYLYIGSSCSELVDAVDRPLPSPAYSRWLRDCASLRARVGEDRIEVIDVPAHRMSWYNFKSGTVPLGLYRLRDPSICALGPSPRSTPNNGGAEP